GRALCLGEVARDALRLLGPGSEAVLSRGGRAAGTVSRRPGALPDHDCALEGAGLARGRALLRDPRRETVPAARPPRESTASLPGPRRRSASRATSPRRRARPTPAGLRFPDQIWRKP